MAKRMHLCRSILWVVVAVASTATAQEGSALYVITGTPNNKGGFGCYCEAELFKVLPGNLTLIRKLATHEGRGIHSVLPDYDRGAIFVASPGGDYPGLEVISIRNPTRVVYRPAIAKEIPSSAWRPYAPSPYPIGSPLGPPSLTSMRLVGSGPEALIQLGFGGDAGLAAVAYAWSEASGSLALRPIEPTAIATVRIGGAFGFPGSGMGDTDLENLSFEDGRWILRRVPIALPPAPELPAERSYWDLLVRSDEATVIRLQHSPNSPAPAAFRQPGVATLRLYRAASKRWEPLEIAGPDPRVRLIGQWLLMITGESKAGREGIVPGKSEQRQPPKGRWHEERMRRPVTTGRFLHENAYYPGVLVIMDVRTGKVWRIQTDRSNSEPLLASDNSVYYRVEDRILRAELLQNGQVGAAALLAQSDELRDAHWAFLGPR